MEISSGAVLRLPLPRPPTCASLWPDGPPRLHLEAAPPGTHSGSRPWPGTWPLPYPQGPTFTAFFSLFF